jgi:hypothetical protein
VGAILLLSAAPVWCGQTSSDAPFTVASDAPSISDYINEMKSQNRAYLQSQTETTKPRTMDVRGDQKDKSTNGHKSPAKAFLYSAVIPGAGQLYTGSKLKAAAFFGLEVLAWTGHIVYHGKGEDNTDKFEAYADTYWQEGRYEQWLFMHWGTFDDDSVFNNNGFSLFTHHLPDTKTQQYYEMIGKYNQFVYGWVDTDIDASVEDAHPTTYSQLRMDYEDMRHDANKMFDRATASLIVVMVNHIVSGFEAALAARNHNKNVSSLADRVSVRAVTAKLNDEYFPMVTMTYKF